MRHLISKKLWKRHIERGSAKSSIVAISNIKGPDILKEDIKYREFLTQR